jgi:hypothetical protein
MDKFNNNITFFLNEKNNKTGDVNDNDYSNYDEIQKMMDDFIDLSEPEIEQDNQHLEQLFFEDNNFKYTDEELFYEKEYTTKDLLKICNYYGIDKDVKMSKCKKKDIISTIVYFESLYENRCIVQKRNTMWKYMNELLNDPKMKKFIIWN